MAGPRGVNEDDMHLTKENCGNHLLQNFFLNTRLFGGSKILFPILVPIPFFEKDLRMKHVQQLRNV